MKYLELEIFNDFSCIGSGCPFTCCGGWGIIIDKDSADYYLNVNGDFGQVLKDNIEKNDNGDSLFKLDAEKRCPFLNQKNLCDIYIHLGEDHLCYTCQIYPRYFFVSGDILFSGVSISCPEVARFFLTHDDKLKIDFADDGKPLANENEIEWIAFNNAIRAFSSCIDIVQNREIEVRERLALMILFTYQYQMYVDMKRDPSGVIALFSDPQAYKGVLHETGIYNRDPLSKISFGIELLRYFGRIDDFKAHLPELYELYCYFSEDENSSIDAGKVIEAFGYFLRDDEKIWQEQVLVYGLYRYYMQGFEKGDFYKEFMTGCGLIYLFSVSVMALCYLKDGKMPDFDRKIMIIVHISRLVEHDRNLCDMVMKYFKEKGMTDPAFLFKLIS